MEHVSVDAVATRGRSAAVRAELTEPLSLSDAAVNYYELDPGDGFSGGLHTHTDQEEVFYVQEGTVTFHRGAESDGTVEESETVTVEAGEVVRFAPGEFQRGVNEGDERVRAVAIGAPQESGETEILRACEGCGERTPQTIAWAEDAEGLVTRCLDCDGVTGRFVHGEVEP
jgi:mannose-6-phosphate isomerase-like protein (cupin superfamily)